MKAAPRAINIVSIRPRCALSSMKRSRPDSVVECIFRSRNRSLNCMATRFTRSMPRSRTIFMPLAIGQAWQQQIMGEVIRLSGFVEEAINKLQAEEREPERQRALGQLKVRRLMALMRLGSFEEAEREARQSREMIDSLKDAEIYI